MKFFFAPLLCLSLTLSLPLFAVGSKSSSSAGLQRPLAGGIVFPSLYSSIENNPAGLLHDTKAVVGVDWQVPFQGSTTSSVTEGFAAGGRFFGGGVLIGANANGSTMTINRTTMALAAGAPGTALGLNASYDSASDNLDVDVGLAVENVSGFQISVLLTSVQAFRASGAFNIGLGFTQPNSVQVEASWGYALFATAQTHVLSSHVLFYFGVLGLGANFTYTTSTLSTAMNFGPALSVAFSPRFVLSLRATYDTNVGSSGVVAGNIAF